MLTAEEVLNDMKFLMSCNAVICGL